ncbi:hypothetical protein [Actinomadura rugatobispora]|uniref:HEAT repeat domain-containing protein n=1 Tax=Actinomadura rugatobispora TaxID=1994 RepID=A0ABW1AJS8_9ACTN|nr:hypothetical protein GCM10010200_048640 [Actinomadura rugatobispora]
MSGTPSRANQLAGYRRVLEARGRHTPPERLHELAEDPLPAVRIAIAKNPQTPPQVLRRLADDEHPTVAWNALLRPQMPETGLRRLAELESRNHGRRNLALREAIAHHPNAPEPLRTELTSTGTCRDAITCATMRAALSRAANPG